MEYIYHTTMNRLNIVIILTIFLSTLHPTGVKCQNNCQTATQFIYSDTIDVLHYDIHLTEIDLTSKTIHGYTTVSCTPKFNGISEIRLELAVLNVDSVFVGSVKVPDFVRADPLLRVPLAISANTGDSLELTVYYHGSTFVDPSEWGGFHFAGDYAFNLGVGFDAIPHNLGKAWFPCIDDFRDRALYDVYITVPHEKKASSGGILAGISDNGDQTLTWHWKTAYSLPTYLISASTGIYTLVADTFNGLQRIIPINFFCRPSDSIRVEGTFRNLKAILQIFEELFGPYPFEKVGFTATSIGAMEHAANISYPYSGWNGNTSSEWWYAHELSHMWFGDAVTCASAEDMWLNEGWAVWCESVVFEYLYGEEVAREYLRLKHKEVILSSHTIDGGYYPVYGIPQTITYGNTVYEKGAQVTHTLRHYLGDELFFAGVKAYLQAFAYQPASTCQLRDFLKDFTGKNLDDFFDAWVFEPGFPTFTAGYYEAKPLSPGYEVKVGLDQKLRGRNTYANSNKVELTFLGRNWEKYYGIAEFSGKEGNLTFQIPFQPVAVIPDIMNYISDAEMDYGKVIKTTGEIDFPDTYAKLSVQQLTDSAYIHITHFWVAPDSMKTERPGLRLSENRYWRVAGIIPDNFRSKIKFNYNKALNLDYSLMSHSTDSLVILYRKDSHSDWQDLAFTRQGSANAGILIIDTLAAGEYTLAAWDKTHGIKEPQEKGGNQMRLYPNPSNGNCKIDVNNTSESILRIYDTLGRMVEERRIPSGAHTLDWELKNNEPGVYYCGLFSLSGKELATGKMLFY
jgi:aminopeptidase N